MVQKIRPFLWFDTQAEEAVNFYVSVFPNSTIGRIGRYGEAGPGPAGSVMTIDFELDGQRFTALNGGPHYKFDAAISFVIECKDQAEVDRYWDRLSTDGGQPVQCGWVTDKFGLSWQVVPTILYDLVLDADPEKARKTTQAMLGMIKLDIAGLQAAHDS